MTNVDHNLYRLADFPLLALLAKDKTTATKLDGRACRYVYESGLDKLDPAQISEHEMALIRALRVNLPLQPMMNNLAVTKKDESSPTSEPAVSHRPKYQLADLLAEMPEDTSLTAEEKAWLDMPDVGKEKL